MTTKSEWHRVNRALMAEDRERLGEPPTADEVLAYTRGELPAQEAADVCRRLVAYPDLVRTLTAEFPADAAAPGDPDYMSDDEFAKHWASMQKRLPVPGGGGRVLMFWPAFSAIAATLAAVFGALFWHAHTELLRPQMVWDQQNLVPDGRRGGGDESLPLAVDGESFLLVARLPDTPVCDTYRMEIVDLSVNPPQSRWSAAVLQPRSSEIAILVRRSFFKPGRNQVVLYGSSGGREERLAAYTLRVPPH